MTTTKQMDIARSVKTKLANIANKQNVTYQDMQTSFLLERMAARLLKNSKLSSNLIFKGGYIGLRVFESPRFTIDLDALLKNAVLKEIVELAKNAIQKDIKDGVWFKYEKQADLQTLGEYPGMRIYFRTGIGEPLKNIKKAQSIHLDLGVGDPVVPAPVNIKTKSILGDEYLSWQVYTIESATAEKLHTLIVRHSDNSRAKDIFDIYLFLPKCNIQILKQALTETFKFRGDEFPSDISKVIDKVDQDLLKRGWTSATAGLKEKLDFEIAFKSIILFCEKNL